MQPSIERQVQLTVEQLEELDLNMVDEADRMPWTQGHRQRVAEIVRSNIIVLIRSVGSD